MEEEPAPGVPEWVVTFGDLMALLLCFFVLLFSMSEMKSDEKFQAMADALRKQFGYTRSTASAVPGQRPPLNGKNRKLGSKQFVEAPNMQIAKSAKPLSGRDKMRLKMTRAGELTTLGTIITFEETASGLSDESHKRLQQAAVKLRGKANIIEVRGHASGRPPGPDAPYRDEWELSFQRCHATMRYLVDELGIDSRRIRLSAGGKNEPEHDVARTELMAQNSRVEVFLLNEMVKSRQGPSGQ